MFDIRFLLAIHHADVHLVHCEFASCGMHGNGRWIGFAEAGQALSV